MGNLSVARSLVTAYVLVFAFGSANAATILSGSASFDGATQLWTYSYALDNQTGSFVISDWAVQVNPPPPIVYPMYTYLSSSTAPLDWAGPVPTSDHIGDNFFEWHKPGPCRTESTCSGLPVGFTLSGFSFSVPFAPTFDPYFVFAPFFNQGNVETGLVVGPDANSPTFTPLPSALPLFAAGLGVMGLLGWRRKRKAPKFQNPADRITGPE
jgi:hypothetical protein